MEKTFFQRLQKVKPSDLLHLILFVLAIVPAMIYKKTHKPFWLISECKDEARDNGYWLFKYISEHHKKENIMYAINKKCDDYHKVKNLGKVIQYGSFAHWIAYLACDIRISSQKAGTPNNAICYFIEVYGIIKKKTVFLQHGIIKDDLPYVHSDKAKFSLFATTTKREYEYVKNTFGFNDGVVKQLGLCRFDDLFDVSYGTTVLIVPTWRQWIANPDLSTKNVEKFVTFEDTEYFKKWNEVLNSKEFSDLLRKTNKRAVFYIHRNMGKFGHYFTSKYDNIKVLPLSEDIHELLKKSAILVTDYSSVAMDFAYIDKPVVYYQFDYDKFRKHHLGEGYFSYEKDGFGPIVKTKGNLFKEIETIINNDMELDDKYHQRILDFFDMRDICNCERTYEAIKELSNG